MKQIHDKNMLVDLKLNIINYINEIWLNTPIGNEKILDWIYILNIIKYIYMKRSKVMGWNKIQHANINKQV